MAWDELFPPGGAVAARAAYFLLHHSSPDAGVDTESFVTEILERILRQLTSSTERRTRTSRGRVRGKVVWSATFKSRYTGTYDPTLFICREVHRDFDTPENQLLRYMVEALVRALTQIPLVIRAGVCYFPICRRRDPVTIGERLARIEAELSRLRANMPLRSVTLPDQVTAEHLVRAEASRLDLYPLVAQLYHRYRAMVLESDWAGVARIARTALLLPAEAKADGEPWIRLAAAVTRTCGD